LPYLAVAIGGILVLYLLLRAFLLAEPKALARFLRWFLGLLALLLFTLLVATEQLVPALTLAGAVLTVALRGHAIWTLLRSGFGPRPHASSAVETEYLRMTLDHDSGTMDGVIRRGPHRGRRLAELAQGELVALWRECAAEDPPSARLVETYLDRAAPGWRGGASGAGEQRARQEETRQTGRTGERMTREEAYKILGLAPGASPAAIKAAHHQLMLKLHPDHGGSTYLAAQINAARELLLNG
jgi:hypothetical protein